MRLHIVRCACAADGRLDSIVRTVSGWSSWFDCLEGQDVSLFFHVWVHLWGPTNLLFSGYRFCIHRVYWGAREDELWSFMAGALPPYQCQ